MAPFDLEREQLMGGPELASGAGRVWASRPTLLSRHDRPQAFDGSIGSTPDQIMSMESRFIGTFLGYVDFIDPFTRVISGAIG